MSRRVFRKLVIMLVLASVTLWSTDDVMARRRSSQSVKKEKQKTEQQLRQTKKKIEENQRRISSEVDRLESLKADIALRDDSIRQINLKINEIDSRITVMSDSVVYLEGREKMLKETYSRTLRTLRSRRQSMSDLSFIFSANSFSQAWQRMRYLRDVAKSSTKQARRLSETRQAVASARDELQTLRDEHAAALAKHNEIQRALRAEHAAADNLVKNLRKQGKALQDEMARRNAQMKSLESELEKAIAQEEAERRAAEAKRRAEAERRAAAEAEKRAKSEKESAEKSSAKPAKPEAPAPAEFDSEAEADRRLSGSFASNKGRLLFPVSGRYKIVSNFGTNNLPELSRVKVDNLGIDIEVPAGATARAVFDGVVSSIFRMEGYNYIIIVRHGKYLSVYAGITSPAVQKGESVKAGATLGPVFTPPGKEMPRLHFEIRYETEKLNPAEWVR